MEVSYAFNELQRGETSQVLTSETEEEYTRGPEGQRARDERCLDVGQAEP